MSGIGQSFSDLSYRLTALNKKSGVGGGVGNLGVLGPSFPRTRVRQELDKGLNVAPKEGDPGYVPPPVVTPVTPMPTPGQDDLENVAARRRSIEQQLFRRGRLSTVLSNPQNEPLGG